MLKAIRLCIYRRRFSLLFTFKFHWRINKLKHTPTLKLKKIDAMQKSLFALCMIAASVEASIPVTKKNNGVAGENQGTVAPVKFNMSKEPSTMARNAKFARYAAKKGKNYTTKEEYSERKVLFERNDREIEILNKMTGNK